MWSMAPSAMVVPLSFLRAHLSILTLVSEVAHGRWDIPQHLEIHSRQGAVGLMPGHEQRGLYCLTSSPWAVPSKELQGDEFFLCLGSQCYFSGGGAVNPSPSLQNEQ